MNKVILKNIINQIIRETFDFYEKDENLLTLSIMGSFKDKAKIPDKYNDLDLFFLFKKVNSITFFELEKLLKKIIKNHSSKELEIKYSMLHGPVFKNFSSSNGILIHNIIFDVPLYKKFSPLGIFSCQQDAGVLIKRKDPKKIRKVEKIKVSNAINDMPLGFNASLKIISKSININGEWSKNINKEWQLLPKITQIKKGMDFFDAMSYSVFASLMNFSRLIYGKKANVSK